MLARKYRLPVRFVLPSPITYSSPLLLLKVSKNSYSYNRFAVVVSKKIEKTATGRNTIKRVLRKTFQTLLPTMGVGLDILTVVRRGNAKNVLVLGEDLKRILS